MRISVTSKNTPTKALTREGKLALYLVLAPCADPRRNWSLPLRHPRSLGDFWTGLPDFTASGSSVHLAGAPLQLKGVSWFGAEGAGRAPDGLWVHDIDYYLSFLQVLLQGLPLP